MNRQFVVPVRSAGIARAFTLIELLVAFVIIGLLAALLGAVFGRARGAAKVSACADNLRQIGVALVMYANDNSGLAPPVLTRPHFGADGKLKVIGNIKRWRDLLATYTKSTSVFFCSADPYPGTATPNPGVDKADSLYSSYETSSLVFPSEYGPHDSLQLNIDAPPYAAMPYASDRTFFIPDDNRSDRLGYRVTTFHGNVSTAVYLDAHTKSMTLGG